MDTPEIIVEIRDEEPTTEQVVAYNRFWRLILERLLKKEESRRNGKENYSFEQQAA